MRSLSSLKKTDFSRPQLLMFLVAFALIGFFLVRSFAAGGTPYSLTSSLTDKGTISGQIQWSVAVSPQPYEVDFYIDGVKQATVENLAPYVFNGDSGVLDTTKLSNGSHSFGEVAIYNNNGGPIYSSTYVNNGATIANTHKVTVSNAAADTTAPTVAMTNPLNGSTLNGSLSVSANASDNVGVVGVQFKLDGVSLGAEVLAGPYSTIWNSTTVANGSHTLSATARDAAGNTSTDSITVSVANADTTPPSVPAGLSATATAYNNVSLSWNASTDNVGVTGYYIVRNGVTIAQTGPNSNYSDTTVSATNNYSYQVIAYDAAGNNSGLSSPASVTTPTAPDTTAPTAPTGLSATAVSSSQINLAWGAATDNVGVNGYDVYRNSTKIATVNALSAGDTGLSASTSYSYYVKARDAAGNTSPSSNVASATTQTPVVNISTLQGTIYSSKGGVVGGAQINLNYNGISHYYTSGSDGSYLASNLPSQTTINANYSAKHFYSTNLSLSLPSGQTVTQNVTLISRFR